MWLGLVVIFGCGSGDDITSVDAGGGDFCEAPFIVCGEACVATSNNPSHCGGCNIACADMSFCDNGNCAAICSVGLTACGASCADLASDRNHCGRCDLVCAGDRDCQAGLCVCPEGTRSCGDACVDTNTDRNNCGDCNEICGGDQFCSGGMCQCMGGNRESSCTNGTDDDCDMLVDCLDPDCVGATRMCMGACGQGNETCEAAGTWSVCQGGDGSAEICGDGIDQDCSGADERMPDPFEPNDTCADCKLIQATPDPDLTIMGSFDSVNDPVDCYKFIAEDNSSYREHIRVTLSGIPVGQDYDVYLYRGQGNCEAREPLAFSDNFDNTDEFVEWGERFGSNDDGEYYIEVIRFSGFTCTESYSLRVDGLD